MPEDFKVFERLASEATGVDFNNQLTETSELNYFTHEGFYQGAGLGIGDFNNDGLADIFFAGNMVADRLFINKGNMQFEDVTTAAGVAGNNGWSTGVTIADVNGDGWDDIYVCKFLYDDNQLRKNQLFINNKNLTFTEQAAAFKINDPGYSIQANFFDYNNDGLLDLYVANQPPNNTQYRESSAGKRDYQYTDHLFKNNGDGTFSNVTDAAGLTNYSFSLGVVTADINKDGWMDLYVASDYEEPDFMYLNNGDGTFSNLADEALRHMSNFSMGVDIADINNDGWQDIFTADMVAYDNARLKSNMSGMNPAKFWNLAENGYHYQYMFNALQLNNGNGTFSEIGQLAGVSNTDWSWASLFADFDNDGHKDLIVTNGLYRDMRNNDFNIMRRKFMEDKLEEAKAMGIKTLVVDPLELIEKAPSTPIRNFIFQNNGDLTFTQRNTTWGLADKGFSHGTVYVDLDNDGDLDVVMNNLNEEAGIYKNRTSDNQYHQFLRVKPVDGTNKLGVIGAQVSIYYGNGAQQMQELAPTRGYMSTCENILHFGLGTIGIVDKLVVRWPDGTETVKNNIKAGQLLIIDKSEAKPAEAVAAIVPYFEEVKGELPLQFEHTENVFDDYEREILLPHKMSTLGPVMITGDVNGDGLADVFIGGAVGQVSALFIQNSKGTFEKTTVPDFETDKLSEDVGALFFDADNDGDIDLYVVSGGNDYVEEDPALQDRLYLNDGKGSFSKANGALSSIRASGMAVAAADIDGDGDQDLFIGGRQIPGKYGFPANSSLLLNENGKFRDVTLEKAKGLIQLGMVSSAVWMDTDNDGDVDLVLAGEWMPLTIFENTDGIFNDATEKYGTTETSGWWNVLKVADLDGDGDEDIVAGNLGLNIKYKASISEPFTLYAKDFDRNGTHDVYLGYYDHDGVCYPVRGRQCSSQQLPFVKKEFPSYEAFSKAPIESVLGERMVGAVQKKVQLFENVWFENADGRFITHILPNEAQVAPVEGIVTVDINEDGFLDLILAGNYYEREVETTRSDAGIGCVLLNNGKGMFSPVHPTKTGIKATGDVREIALVNTQQGTSLLLVANNNHPVQVFKRDKLVQ